MPYDLDFAGGADLASSGSAAWDLAGAGAGAAGAAGTGIDFLGGLSGYLPKTAQGYLGLGATGLALGTGIAGLTGGESASERRLRQLAQAQQAQATQFSAETAPLRAQALQRITAALDPNTPVNVSPARDALERQFLVARNRTIEGAGARGGALTGALRDLEGQRAVGVGSLEQAARDQALSQALQIGFGVAPSAASASTNAALNAFSNLNQISAQRETAAGSAIGQAAALSALLSMKGGKT